MLTHRRAAVNATQRAWRLLQVERSRRDELSTRKARRHALHVQASDDLKLDPQLCVQNVFSLLSTVTATHSSRGDSAFARKIECLHLKAKVLRSAPLNKPTPLHMYLQVTVILQRGAARQRPRRYHQPQSSYKLGQQVITLILLFRLHHHLAVQSLLHLFSLHLIGGE
jgi:hypothetical protein|eukprot:COSAG02_NODE_3414_length_6785_cov_3.121448_7_plen_168_part_00